MKKSEKSNCKVIGFLGFSAYIIARFVSAIMDHECPVLVLDASESKRLMINVLGEINREDVVFYHKLYYTDNVEFMMDHVNDYDVILLYDDCVSNYEQYKEALDYIYFTCGTDRISLKQYQEIFQVVSKNECVPYSNIVLSTYDESKRNHIESLFRMCRAYSSFKKYENNFFLPIQACDKAQFDNLSYGCLDFNKLSSEMQEYLNSVRKSVHQERSICNRNIVYGL